MSELKFDIFADLQARGLISQCTDEEVLKEHLNTGMRTLYCGFDPTADSLHIGSLVPLLTLRRFQLAGHRPLSLVGGATGLIGDPSFKAQERVLNSDDIVEGFVSKLKTQISPFLDFENGENAAKMVNNLDWTQPMSVITFLRDIGKHYSVNNMLNKESVKQRIDRDGSGISFTEFSYSILQGMDFLELYKAENCTLQLGGSDQWGNIVSGTDLTRRSTGKHVFALTLPLITKADGTKFGKTESGTVWLSAHKTSAYAFYQFWINTMDEDVEKFLKLFTFLTIEEIAKISAEHAEAPFKRLGQKTLAEDVTRTVHGEEGLEAAKRITEALFSGSLDTLTADDLAQIGQDGMPSASIDTSEITLMDALKETGIASSNREARDFIKANAISVNGEKVTDIEKSLSAADALHGKYIILRRGKKNYAMLTLS
jgi:tyrosyl-tRNA synthetase